MLDFFTTTIWGGLSTILVGIFSIKLAKSNQKKKDPLNNSGMKGWLAGISLIVIGLIIIIVWVLKKFGVNIN